MMLAQTPAEIWGVLGPALAPVLLAIAAFVKAWLDSKAKALAEKQGAAATLATQATVLGVERATSEISAEVARMLAEGKTPAEIGEALKAKAKATVKEIATAQGAQATLDAVVVGLGLSKKRTAERVAVDANGEART